MEGESEAGAESETIEKAPTQLGEGAELGLGGGRKGRGETRGREPGHEAVSDEIPGGMGDEEDGSARRNRTGLAEDQTGDGGEGKASGGGTDPFAGLVFQEEPRSAPDDGIREERWEEGGLEASMTVGALNQRMQKQSAESEEDGGDGDVESGLADVAVEPSPRKRPDREAREADEREGPGAVQCGVARVPRSVFFVQVLHGRDRIPGAPVVSMEPACLPSASLRPGRGSRVAPLRGEGFAWVAGGGCDMLPAIP